MISMISPLGPTPYIGLFGSSRRKPPPPPQPPPPEGKPGTPELPPGVPEGGPLLPEGGPLEGEGPLPEGGPDDDEEPPEEDPDEEAPGIGLNTIVTGIGGEKVAPFGKLTGRPELEETVSVVVSPQLQDGELIGPSALTGPSVSTPSLQVQVSLLRTGPSVSTPSLQVHFPSVSTSLIVKVISLPLVTTWIVRVLASDTCPVSVADISSTISSFSKI
jgi:hypothetical protein